MSLLEPKLCKNCHWVYTHWLDRVVTFIRPYTYAVCTNPKFSLNVNFESLVDGRNPSLLFNYEFCATLREDQCGVSGVGWEPRRDPGRQVGSLPQSQQHAGFEIMPSQPQEQKEDNTLTICSANISKILYRQDIIDYTVDAAGEYVVDRVRRVN